MDRMIYTAMSGAKAPAQRQEAVTNNLANAATTGFRADLMSFRAVPVQGAGTASTRVTPRNSRLARHTSGHLPLTRTPPGTCFAALKRRPLTSA